MGVSHWYLACCCFGSSGYQKKKKLNLFLSTTWIFSSVNLFVCMYIYISVLEFELKLSASHLLGRFSLKNTTWFFKNPFIETLLY
jgi:hypothetical protein